MGNVTLLAGIGIVCFVLVYMFFKLREDKEKQHGLLQILLLFLLLGGILLIGKSVYDNKDFCSWLPTNSTENGTTINYNYTYSCETNTNNTAFIFYKSTLWLMRLFVGYIFIFYSYKILIEWLGGKIVQ